MFKKLFDSIKLKFTNTPPKPLFSRDFSEGSSPHIKAHKIFNEYFKIPQSFIHVPIKPFDHNVDIKDLHAVKKRIEHFYGNNYYRFLSSNSDNRMEEFLLLYDHLVFYCNIRYGDLLAVFDEKKYNKHKIKELGNYILNDSRLFSRTELPPIKQNINLIVYEGPKLTTRSYELNEDENEIDLELNYNDDFLEIDNKIRKHIHDGDNGIVLLHGESGTGKTTYIKKLIKDECKEKLFVWIPPNMTNILTDPSFLQFAIDYLKNSVLVIEDAENILRKRMEGQQTQSVANLLNISDGILSNILNLQIICTFNCPLSEVDEALTRKGRMLMKYEFGKLTPQKANQLFKTLEIDRTTNEPLTLSDIYNSEDNNAKANKKQIGFK